MPKSWPVPVRRQLTTGIEVRDLTKLFIEQRTETG
jgi:hypothetical protein